MRPSKTSAAKHTTKAASKAEFKQHKIPPDPWKTNEECAARAKKVIAPYRKLAGAEYAVFNLLHDLMHLCDRDPTLGNLHEDYVFALENYEEHIDENYDFREDRGGR